MRYSDYVKFAPVSLTYEEWANLEAGMKKELQIMAEADEAVVNMLVYTNLPQELHNEIVGNLEKMRKEFDELENKYYDLKINRGGLNE